MKIRAVRLTLPTKVVAFKQMVIAKSTSTLIDDKFSRIQNIITQNP